MGNWYQTEIEFLDPRPSEGEARALATLLRSIDRDAPALTTTGLKGKWRNPALDVEAIADVFHWLGFPCRSRSWSDLGDYGVPPPNEPFTDSQPRIVAQHYQVQILSEGVELGLLVADERHGVVPNPRAGAR